MDNQAHDNPNVIIFPPMLLLATIITGIVLDWLVPIGLLDVVSRWARMIVGAIRRCQSKILNTWSGHRTAQIDPEKCMKINGREIRF